MGVIAPTVADILRMAREAGFQTGVIHGADGSPVQALVQPIGHNSCIVELERFYALAVAKEREARQDAQSRCEELKARIVKAGVERRRAVMDEREACANAAMLVAHNGIETSAVIRARGES